MGYRSQVYLKTTTEGYVMIKKADDEITTEADKPLAWSEVKVTSSGNYKITWDDIKWYDSYPNVQKMNELMNKMDDLDIPYSFIRIGEDSTDVEWKHNYPDDMPWEIESFEPLIDVNDEEWSDYTDVEC